MGSMVPLSPEFLRLLAVVAVLNLPVYALIWLGLFGGWDDFTAAVYFWLSPNWLDWYRGESDEDAWQHAKLLLFLVLGALLVVSESVNIQHKLPGLATTLSGWAGGARVP
jgi:hypothetical protein